jgi:23S rRNA pseudouridine1911/1915/1917 synthase
MPEKTVAVPRTMLHAHTLRIAHPKTGEPCVWTAPLPNDFVSLAEHAGYRRETLETK